MKILPYQEEVSPENTENIIQQKNITGFRLSTESMVNDNNTYDMRDSINNNNKKKDCPFGSIRYFSNVLINPYAAGG